MCGIALSTDLKELTKLVALNTPRGTRVHSVTRVTNQGTIIQKQEGKGPLSMSNVLSIPAGGIVITHQQAPTSEAGVQSHPAVSSRLGMKLWHNGIIKAREVRRLQTELNIESDWDTEILMEAIFHNTGRPPVIDGSFACIMIQWNSIYAFRNEIAPLYASYTGISSAKFEGAVELEPGWMYKIKRTQTGISLEKETEFEIRHNPYFLGGEGSE